ncbi:MAG TPA: TasA family protein [Acidimicrobiales bacterium]|nr:TasA family protein [Acidimicrobiales bacterium]
MAAHSIRSSRTRSRKRVALAAAFAAGVLALTGAGVYAGLNAVATGTADVTSGTLSLTVTADVGAGFGQTISNMAPGDTYNSFVKLTNGANLAAKDLTLAVTGSGSTLLTTDGTKGLAVAVTQCSVAWTLATGACSGSTTALLASTPVATLSSTPGSVVSGAIAASTVWHLKVSVSLPDQSETTTNGTPPGGTIQGLSTTLTFTFSESQRTAVTTNA